jgi:hypothetical protein
MRIRRLAAKLGNLPARHTKANLAGFLARTTGRLAQAGHVRRKIELTNSSKKQYPDDALGS